MILKLKILVQKLCMTMSTYELPVTYFCLKPNLGTKYMIGWTLSLIHIVCACKFFMTTSFLRSRLRILRIGDVLGKRS